MQITPENNGGAAFLWTFAYLAAFGGNIAAGHPNGLAAAEMAESQADAALGYLVQNRPGILNQIRTAIEDEDE